MKILLKARGYMPGMAKHIANLIGSSEPGFFTRCTQHPWVREACAKGGYDIKALCSRAHKLALGYYPTEKKSSRFSNMKGYITGRVVHRNE